MAHRNPQWPQRTFYGRFMKVRIKHHMKVCDLFSGLDRLSSFQALSGGVPCWKNSGQTKSGGCKVPGPWMQTTCKTPRFLIIVALSHGQSFLSMGNFLWKSFIVMSRATCGSHQNLIRPNSQKHVTIEQVCFSGRKDRTCRGVQYQGEPHQRTACWCRRGTRVCSGKHIPGPQIKREIRNTPTSRPSTWHTRTHTRTHERARARTHTHTIV